MKVNKFHIALLEKFNNEVGENSALARSYIQSMDYKNNPYLLNCIALTYRDQALFKKNGERRKKTRKKYLKLAKQFSDEAFALNPSCINILFIRGTILNHLDQIDDAINCFLEIIQIEDFKSPSINCSNMKKKDLLMIQNDSNLQLHNLMEEFYSKKLAKKFLKAYKIGLKKGINTIYNIDY